MDFMLLIGYYIALYESPLPPKEEKNKKKLKFDSSFSQYDSNHFDFSQELEISLFQLGIFVFVLNLSIIAYTH